VISDKKVCGSVTGTTADYYLAEVIHQQDYYPFGSSMPGRSYDLAGAATYRYGFNGKEKDDEVKGAGNSLDFGARIYDPRLGRWMSVDPLASRYAYISPYNGFANNPIIYVDHSGKDNVIYLVYLPDKKTTLKKADVEAIRDQANENFKNMGIKTRVVLVTDQMTHGNTFDANKIDKTDAVAVLGSKKNIVNYVKKFDNDFATELQNSWEGNFTNPERSQNKYSDVPKRGKFIAVEENSIAGFGVTVGVKGTSQADIVKKTGGLIINHGVGHTADLSHAYDNTETTNSPVMADANTIYQWFHSPDSSYPKIEDITNNKPNETHPNGRNADYKDAVEKRYGKNNPKVNYKQ
jgi:RHS repeat-associated protein